MGWRRCANLAYFMVFDVEIKCEETNESIVTEVTDKRFYLSNNSSGDEQVIIITEEKP